jgi:hypothetical protein
VSPIIRVSAGSVSSSAISSSSISGAGLDAHWSAQRVASKSDSSPVCASARARPALLLPVAIASA